MTGKMTGKNYVLSLSAQEKLDLTSALSSYGDDAVANLVTNWLKDRLEKLDKKGLEDAAATLPKGVAGKMLARFTALSQAEQDQIKGLLGIV